MDKKILILVLFFSAELLIAQTELNVEKFRIYPSPVTQTEPIVTSHPNNSLILFASARTLNTANAFQSEGVYVSTDGGISWKGSDTCNGAFIFNHGGDPGVVISESGKFILSHIGDIFPGMYTHNSPDMGINWSDAVTVTNHQTGDKGTTTIDNANQSSFKGRIYIAWTELVSPFATFCSYSTDDGSTWSTPKLVNPNPPLRCTGGSVSTANNGNVYVSWSAITSTAPFREDFAGFAVSSDGGESWSAQQNIFDMNGISGTLPSKEGIRVNGLPQVAVDNSEGVRDGWIYVVTTEINIAPAGSDPDIILHRSTDNGQTWSSGLRVNQDQLNNGMIQYFPILEIDNDGNLNILFYDDRNTTSDSTDVFLTHSTDGGNIWSEYFIKNSRFKPKPILGGTSAYQGDHIALHFTGNFFYAFWMADYSGIYQVWMAIIDRNIFSIEDDINHPVNSFTLLQNYPNPLNPSTKIKYQIPELSFVTLKVYDLLGREISILVQGEKPVGSYEVKFDGRGLSSGIYFYRLQAGNFVETKKMVLIK
jgi:hypothetical protein